MRVAVVGLGVMGSLLALKLAKIGWQVTIFDQDKNNCSQAAAGLLTPFSELDRTGAEIFSLGQESIQNYWPAIRELLTEPFYFKNLGSLVVFHPQDEAEWLQFSKHLTRQAETLDNYGLRALEPELAKFEKAYYFPEEAQLDCQTLMRILHRQIQTMAVKSFLNTEVLAVEPGLVKTIDKTFNFDLVFDCRGLGAKSVFADLRPLRGELIWLKAADVCLTRPLRLLHPRFSLYIVPRPDNIYLIGSTEIEADDLGPISLKSTVELLTAAYYVHPGFSEARILKTVTQCRPTLANHLPRIKASNGLIAINGLYRHGYLIAPALVEEVLRGLNNQASYPQLWEKL